MYFLYHCNSCVRNKVFTYLFVPKALLKYIRTSPTLDNLHFPFLYPYRDRGGGGVNDCPYILKLALSYILDATDKKYWFVNF